MREHDGYCDDYCDECYNAGFEDGRSSSRRKASSSTNSGKNPEGCYIATCVYGSYDCPEVWTLRRFRDNVLANSGLGQIFIRSYYAVSPKIVRHFGKHTWFTQLWKIPLDSLVGTLNRNGIEDGQYQDRLIDLNK